MPNRTEAAQRKPRQLATGRLQPLRLFSTPPRWHRTIVSEWPTIPQPAIKSLITTVLPM
jgi:hypothetical protein